MRGDSLCVGTGTFARLAEQGEAHPTTELAQIVLVQTGTERHIPS